MTKQTVSLQGGGVKDYSIYPSTLSNSPRTTNVELSLLDNVSTQSSFIQVSNPYTINPVTRYYQSKADISQDVVYEPYTTFQVDVSNPFNNSGSIPYRGTYPLISRRLQTTLKYSTTSQYDVDWVFEEDMHLNIFVNNSTYTHPGTFAGASSLPDNCGFDGLMWTKIIQDNSGTLEQIKQSWNPIPTLHDGCYIYWLCYRNVSFGGMTQNGMTALVMYNEDESYADGVGWYFSFRPFLINLPQEYGYDASTDLINAIFPKEAFTAEQQQWSSLVKWTNTEYISAVNGTIWGVKVTQWVSDFNVEFVSS